MPYNCFNCVKNSIEILVGIVLHVYIILSNTDILTELIPLTHEHGTSFLYICIFFKFFYQCFMVLSVQTFPLVNLAKFISRSCFMVLFVLVLSDGVIFLVSSPTRLLFVCRNNTGFVSFNFSKFTNSNRFLWNAWGLQHIGSYHLQRRNDFVSSSFPFDFSFSLSDCSCQHF